MMLNLHNTWNLNYALGEVFGVLNKTRSQLNIYISFICYNTNYIEVECLRKFRLL